MSIELVTGHAGSAHVTSAQDGRLNAAAWGTGKYVLPLQSQFAITVDSANQVTVGTGDVLLEGRHITSEAPTTLTVDSGTQNMKRNDLVCIVYSKDGQGVESATLEVVKGTESSGTPTDPAVPSGSVLAGDTTCAMALWRLPIDGISLGEPVSMFDATRLLSDDTRYYLTGREPSAHDGYTVGLMDNSGDVTSELTIPIATNSASGVVRLGPTLQNSNNVVDAVRASGSKDGIMPASMYTRVTKATSSSESGAHMGWGYRNSGGSWWLYFPVRGDSWVHVRLNSIGAIDVRGNGATDTIESRVTANAQVSLINGGTLLQVEIPSSPSTSIGNSEIVTAYTSSLSVTFTA